jgi:CRISPR-associated protein Csc1
MSEGVKLADHGICLWQGRLANHDFLWFATSDLNATACTWPILHNYALTYAICQYSHAAYTGYRPKYDDDLNHMQAYALPSYNPLSGRTRLTHNAIDDVTQRTDTIVGGGEKATPARFNTPKLGRRICLTPVMDRTNSVPHVAQRNVGFEVYAFTWDDFRPPSVFRLGKKGCPIRVTWQEAQDARARIPDGEFSPTHPLNPRDLMRHGSVVSFYPAIMPPHLLYTEARLQGEWAVPLAQGRWVHVPRRIVHRWQVAMNQGSGTS